MRKLPLTLCVAAGIATAAPHARTLSIAVDYTLAGYYIDPGLGPSPAHFLGDATLHFEGAGIEMLSPGRVGISAPYTVFSDIRLPGAFQITGRSAIAATGSGSLASNGLLTFGLQRVVASGFVHCLDLSPLGCQTFVMVPASVPLPQTGNTSRVGLRQLNHSGASQPPAVLEFGGRNLGGNSTGTLWTFSEVAGSRRIVPEPAPAGLVGLGLIGLALARILRSGRGST